MAFDKYRKEGGQQGKPGSRQAKPFKKDGQSGKPGPRQAKPYNRDGQPAKPYSRDGEPAKPEERQDRPYEKKVWHDKPYKRDGQQGKPYQGTRPYNKDGEQARPYQGPRQDRSYNRDGEQARPYQGPRQDRSYNRDGEQARPYQGPRQDRPYNRDGEQARPYQGPRQDRPYGKDGEQARPYQGPRQDRPYGKDGEQARPYQGPRQDRPYEKKVWQDKPYNRDGEQARPYQGSGQDRPFDKRPRDQYSQRPSNDLAPQQEPVLQVNPEDELPYLIMGRNGVREAIKSGRSIDRILMVKEPDGSLREILGMARDSNIQVREVDRVKLDELCMPFGHGGKSGNHQGVVAQVPGVEYCEISDILNVAKARGELPFIILLDGIEDPHNLGSILRSAECAGAHGVIIPKRRSASVTASACKASAGAVEYVKVARVVNLSGAIGRLKEEGIWIAGADMQGTPMAKTDMKGALGLVIGSESSGISKLVKEKCDFLVSIPLWGKMESLNAAVAAAILMFEKKRQS